MEYLNRKLTVRNMELTSRLVMPPMVTSGSDENGLVTQKLLDYYDAKTQGGYLGMVITEHSYVSPEGMAHPKQMSICKDEDIPGLAKLVEVIHKNGVKAVAQISHGGAASRQKDTGYAPVAPSEIAFSGEEKGHVLTKEDISRLVERFASAARRAVAAGFDGVEIHSAHRYLLNQFYSPLSNTRTDEYGGPVENRVRLHLEILRAVRQVIGTDKALLLRLGAVDYTPGGNTIEDAVAAAKLFEAEGLDLLDISGGMTGYIVKGREDWQGYYTPETARLKQELSIPVLMTGGVTDPQAAEEILKDGKADLIGVGRALLKDSRWAEKAMKGEM